MNLFLLNLFLALLWCALQGSFQLPDLLVGSIFGGVLIALGQRGLGHRPGYLRSLFTLLRFLFFSVKEIILANIALAKVLVRPRLELNPAVVAIRLQPQTEGPITTLANLITLTPGTITLDVAPDGRTIYVHNLVLGDVESFRNDIKRYERRVLEVFNELGEQEVKL